MSAPLVINEESHEALPTFAHRVGSAFYTQILYTAGRVTTIAIWTDAGMTVKIRDSVLTYGVDGKLATITRRQFASDGITVVATRTGTVTRDVGGAMIALAWV